MADLSGTAQSTQPARGRPRADLELSLQARAGDDARGEYCSALKIDTRYPRPRLVRRRWASLDGRWDFCFGAGKELDTCLPRGEFDRSIVVPYPPESTASGVGDVGPHSVFWYRLRLQEEKLAEAGWTPGAGRLLLHFGAVDHAATVWVGPLLVATHQGGMTPFSVDITEPVALGHRDLVVRAIDDPSDVSAPRGKQDWRTPQHSIWYNRTSGIWQPVWLEAVPDTYVAGVQIESAAHALLDLSVDVSSVAGEPVRVGCRARHGDDVLGEHEVVLAGPGTAALRVVLSRQLNGQQRDELLWSPDHPNLIELEVWAATGETLDRVGSYAGLRTVRVGQRRFWLNDRPLQLRAVLDQGYWPESHLAAPDGDALRREVESIKELGFNCVRMHQKVEDPRFLYWADRLGLLVWGEMAATYEFSPIAIRRLTAEWSDVVTRDRSHPCIVVWVPFNESWGIQDVAHDPRQRSLVRAITSLTRSLDPTRPVVSNDGWEHVDSEILTIHDYADSGELLERRYGSPERIEAALNGVGGSGRITNLAASPAADLPVMITEFGGISLAVGQSPDSWGYSEAADEAEFGSRLEELFGAIHRLPIAGFCYTQLTDTGLETNGLLHADRSPKTAISTLSRLVRGR